MRTRRLATVLALSIIPAIASSQQTPSDSTPHAGTWGAEVFLGSAGAGASILRFQSPRLALLFGADFNVSHIDSDSDGQISGSSGTSSNVAARLGMRTYRQSSAEQLRPVVGFGVRAAYAKGPSEFRTWSTGVYGELGAVYFLTPHVSLGGTAELQANYGKRSRQSDRPSRSTRRRLRSAGR
jgi:hypothetical protein